MQTQLPIKRALMSVSNKKGIVEFATQLIAWNIEIVATGGTAQLLKEQQIPVTEVSHYTGFPEIMDGRVKTLHPKIHAGLLARRGRDEATLAELDIGTIDLLVVNLYPFRETIAKPNCALTEAIEHIDIGGPTLLRAAAKNYTAVTVVIDPDDYPELLEEMQKQPHGTTLRLRQRLAQKVFANTSSYDNAIADYLLQQTAEVPLFAEHYQPQFQRQEILRYGENPHQQAAYYKNITQTAGTLADTKLLQGKTLSYNNMIDADCALQAILELDPHRASCVIIKHATPCGVAEGDNLLAAYTKAYRCDPESAFGGIIAFNQTLTANVAATLLDQQFVEVVLAPNIAADAALLFTKKPNIRLLQYNAQSPHTSPPLALHTISGGLLVQQQDTLHLSQQELTVVTAQKPSADEWRDLLFAWRVVKFVKSNAIVFAKDTMTLGIGGGQTSRVFSAKIAVLRAECAGLSLENAAMASDAFFPFADSIEFAAKHNIRTIIQPGGSKRDDAVINAANAAGIAMVFTGTRHFRH